MTMIIQMNKKMLLGFFKIIFEGVDLKEKGYSCYIPISSDYITINNVDHFFSDKNKHYYLVYDSYGQMSVQYSENALEKPSDRMSGQCPINYIMFEFKDLSQISFKAPNEMHEINPETNEYYYDLFNIELIESSK